MSEIISTGFRLAQAVISNGQVTGNEFSDPNNLLLVDDDVSQSNPNNAASDVIIGNFIHNLPQDAVVVGIEMKIIGYRGGQVSPPITLTPYAVDNTSGSDLFYAYDTPFSGFTPTMDEYLLGGQNYLFNTDWTVDMINNFKLQLVANGDLFIDAALVQVYYYIANQPEPPVEDDENCADCNSPVQAQPFYLALPFLASETKCYLKSFNYPDGTPIQFEDLGACGGYVDLVFDEGKPKQQGSNFEENARTALWTTLPNGTVEIDFVTLSNRALAFKTPYTHDADLLSDHDANTKVIISNNGAFYNRFLRKCHVGVLVSDVIVTEDEGVEALPVTTTFNFIGDDVQVEPDPLDPKKANVTIISNPTSQTPEVEDTTTGSTGAGTAVSLTIPHTIVSANYLRVWVSCDDEVISGVTYDGVAMTLIASETNAPADLKVALYGLLNPNAGANDIVITMAGASHITGGGVAFSNVDPVTPVDGVSSGAIGSSTAPSDAITTTQQNSLVQDVVGAVNNTTGFSQSYPWTVQGEVNAAARPGASSTRKVITPATVTDTYAITPTGAWAIILAGVRGQAIAPGGVDSVTDDGNGMVIVDNTDPANPVIEANGKIMASGADTTPDYIDTKLDIISSDNSVLVAKSIQNPGANEVIEYDLTKAVGGVVLLDEVFLFSDFANDGSGNGVASFTDAMPLDAVPAGAIYEFTIGFIAGSTMQVLDDLVHAEVIGSTVPADVVQTVIGQSDGGALFDWATYPNPVVKMPGVLPAVGSVRIKIVGSGGAGQSAIQFEDEGVNLGTQGSVTEVDFVGAGVVATRAANKVTVTINGSASGEVVQKDFAQTAHGFAVGNVLKSSGTDGEFALAEADTAANADVVGVVSAVADANNFTLTVNGFTILAGALPGGAVTGDNLYLSDSVAGALTLTEPTAVGTISQPLGRVIDDSTDEVYINNWRGIENTATPGGSVTYKNGTTTKNVADASTTQNIAHGLGTTPSKIRLTFYGALGGTADGVNNATVVYNGTACSVAGYGYANGANRDMASGSDIKLYGNASGNETEFQTGVITMDATNIIITWTKTNSPTGTYDILWEAEA